MGGIRHPTPAHLKASRSPATSQCAVPGIAQPQKIALLQ